MAHLRMHRHPSCSRRQRGLTLIEFMVSVTIGLMMVAAIATLIADQSGSRAEVDRSGRMIENGRYAVRAMTDDLQLASYWGELNGVPSSAALAALPDPCSLVLADIEAASQLHIQGYDAPPAASVPACATNQKTGTDILVVRHADPDSGSLDFAALALAENVGRVFVQTGLNAASSAFFAEVNVGDASAATNGTNFPLVKKDKVTPATIRKFVVRIYYVAKCSVEVAGSCDAGDGGNPIPTLKMRELGQAGGVTAWSTPVTIAEGIENMQVDYGVDSDSDGAPDGADVNGSALALADWPNVMAVKIHLLARSLEKTPGHVDAKTYAFGTSPSWTPSADADAANLQAYKRHVFVQSVRLVNPSARRQS